MSFPLTRDTGPLAAHLLGGLKNILHSCCGDDGSSVCSVRLQGKRQASHELHAQVCDGDTVIQDNHCLLSQDGVRERRENLRKQAGKLVCPLPAATLNSLTDISLSVFSQLSAQ